MKNTALLRRRILARRTCIGVVGLGDAGLTLACIAAEAGFPVTGIDTDRARVDELADGHLVVPGVLPALFRGGIASGSLKFTTEAAALAESEIIVICVRTSLRNSLPDLSLLESACREVSRHLSPSRLVILESASPPGTTEHVVLPVLQSSGLRAGRDFLLACSPDRIDPGNEEFSPRSVPKIVGGFTPEATGVAALFYGQLIEKVVVVSSCRAAELAKFLENTFRHVNIALANEMAMLCHKMGIDVWEVIDAAATKPFGFMTFHPGPGVGGHSIPLEPTVLEGATPSRVGSRFHLLDDAREINSRMPGYVASRITEALEQSGKSTKAANVLVLGVSYKADVGDLRESPALRTISHLRRLGAHVNFHDPYLSEVVVDGTVLHRSELTRRAVESADCVAILTPHRVYDLEWIVEHAHFVFDARNAYRDYRNIKVQRL